MTAEIDPRLARHLDDLDPERRERARSWVAAHGSLIAAAAGSSGNHQAWPGGWLDHTLQLMSLADLLVTRLPDVHPLPRESGIGSLKLVLLFHDVEKVFKYGGGEPMGFDKPTYLFRHLPREWGIVFDDAEINALLYVHGEGDDYRKDRRAMGTLAALAHACDVLSARVWHDLGAPSAA